MKLCMLLVTVYIQGYQPSVLLCRHVIPGDLPMMVPSGGLFPWGALIGQACSGCLQSFLL